MDYSFSVLPSVTNRFHMINQTVHISIHLGQLPFDWLGRMYEFSTRLRWEGYTHALCWKNATLSVI